MQLLKMMDSLLRNRSELYQQASAEGAQPLHRWALSERQHGQLHKIFIIRAIEAFRLRSDGGAERGGRDQRHARLHVLGGRIALGTQELRGYGSSEYL